MSTDYPSDWETRRKDVYQRDGYKCQNCGRNGGPQSRAELHAHHIVPKSKGGTHQRSNLITVCKDCHNAIHGNSSAPTSTGRTSTHEELAVAVVDTINSISQSDAASNDAIDRLFRLFATAQDGGEFPIDEYEAIRYEIIKQAFKTKEEIQEYQSTIRHYLSQEAQTDIDSYVDATWESIKSKVFVTGHADDILMEFADRDIKCTECGKVIDPDAEFCKHCGDAVELVPECSSCGNELTSDSNFCSQCGSEVTNELKTDEQLPVDEQAIDEHADEMMKEIEDTIDKTMLVQLLEEKFELVWLEDYSPVWKYCPNCGLERGVLSKLRTAECVLCNAEWKKRGILNTYWEGSSIPNMEARHKNDHSDMRWSKFGREKYEDEVYLRYLDDLIT